MAHQMTVLYHHPDDAVAFDAYYESTHAPLDRDAARTEVVRRAPPAPEPGRGQARPTT